jgi:hypothetical protein
MPNPAEQRLRSCRRQQRGGGDDREQQQSEDDPVDDKIAVVDTRRRVQIDRLWQTEPGELSQRQVAAALASKNEQRERQRGA